MCGKGAVLKSTWDDIHCSGFIQFDTFICLFFSVQALWWWWCWSPPALSQIGSCVTSHLVSDQAHAPTPTKHFARYTWNTVQCTAIDQGCTCFKHMLFYTRTLYTRECTLVTTKTKNLHPCHMEVELVFFVNYFHFWQNCKMSSLFQRTSLNQRTMVMTMEMLKIPAMILWCQILQHQPSIDSVRAGLDLIKRKKKPWKMHGGQTTLGGANVSQMPLVQNGIGDVLLCSPRWSIGLHHQLAAAQTHPKQHLMLALARWGRPPLTKTQCFWGGRETWFDFFSPQNPTYAQCIQEDTRVQKSRFLNFVWTTASRVETGFIWGKDFWMEKKIRIQSHWPTGSLDQDTPRGNF